MAIPWVLFLFRLSSSYCAIGSSLGSISGLTFRLHCHQRLQPFSISGQVFHHHGAKSFGSFLFWPFSLMFHFWFHFHVFGHLGSISGLIFLKFVQQHLNRLFLVQATKFISYLHFWSDFSPEGSPKVSGFSDFSPAWGPKATALGLRLYPGVHFWSDLSPV